MNKNILTAIVTSAVLAGIVSVLALPYWTDAQASSKKGRSEHEYSESGKPSSYERHDDDEREYDEDGNYRRQVQLPNNAAWRGECGDCHVAYPPSMLPAASWRAVMEGLSDHFGVDASIDPQTRDEISDFLARNAGSAQYGDQQAVAPRPLLRITETPWFKHEHQEELPASIWQNPQVKSAANCEACHTKAAQGDYDEDNIRLPQSRR